LPYNGSKKYKGEIMFNFWDGCVGYLIISILIGLFAGYAYLVNKLENPKESKQKDFEFIGIFLAPITWPFVLVIGLIVTIFKALLFGVFLLLFALIAVLFRKPFFWPFIEPIIKSIGARILKINTFLIRLFIGNR
jgi:ABC-type Na+ efflux pump permease subunit